MRHEMNPPDLITAENTAASSNYHGFVID